MLNKPSYKYLLLLFLNVLFFVNLKAETKDQNIKVALRSIGHEFLLQIKDTSSRILAIEKIEGRYVVAFENEFSFEPDLLFFAAFKVMEENKIAESYIVEVENCETNKVVHSFKASLKKEANKNMIACKERTLPKDCYVFYFTEIEKKEFIILEKPISKPLWKNNYVLLGFIFVAVLIFYFFKRKRSIKANAELINIGKYRYDQKGMVLTLKEQSIELSSKEADLLLLLLNNENKTLEREYILTQVWGDDGNYVGRTLDVFISKLRKKLEADPSLKIINIRGVGYRFVIN